MKALLRLWLFLCVIGSLISLYQAMAIITSQEHEMNRVFLTMMTESQKRGGVFPDMIERLEKELGLPEDMVQAMDIHITPGIGIVVQKRESMMISWTPIHRIKVFGGGDLVYRGERRVIQGVSHLYRKK